MQTPSSAQKIAIPPFPVPQTQQQSHTPQYQDDTFDPASYARAVLGVPIPDLDFNSDEPISSFGNDDEEVMQTQDELCRDYACCGIQLSDLHTLVRHFEDAHVEFVDTVPLHDTTFAQYAARYAAPYYPQRVQHRTYPAPWLLQQPITIESAQETNSTDSRSPSSPTSSTPQTPRCAFALDSQRPNIHPPSVRLGPVSAFDTAVVTNSLGNDREDSVNDMLLLETMHNQLQSTVAIMPSALGNQDAAQVKHETETTMTAMQDAVTISPIVLLDDQQDTQVEQESAASTVTAEIQTSTHTDQSLSPTDSAHVITHGTLCTSYTDLPQFHRALTSIIQKPFPCPKSNCEKSYKQANGLKYHLAHGSCSHVTSKEVQAVHTLLTEKGFDIDGDLSEIDARELEREAVHRVRPFACSVSDCTRRYKGIGGLRYHYTHSGWHGIEGLRLLASGQHEALQHHSSRIHKNVQAHAQKLLADTTRLGRSE